KLVVLKLNANGVTQNSGGGVNRSVVTRRYANAAGIAVASLEAMPAQMIEIFRQPNQLLKAAEDPDLPSFLYVNKRVADALVGGDDRPPQLDSAQQAKVNALIADIRKRSNGATARRDSIYNGADDDGSGSVSALEIAQYFASQKVKPKRSLLFVWHVGEEAGLYGSEWYTDHPTVPRDSIVAQLNMDMVGRGAAADNTGITKQGQRYHGNPNYVQLVGSRRLSSELGDLAEVVNETEK